MKKCIVLSDSFKGTLSSVEIARLAKSCIAAEFPGCEVVAIPVADGGEGTVDCFYEVCGGQKVAVAVSGPFGEPVRAEYLRTGDTAVVEMACCAGLPLAGEARDPCRATTYGVGELIRHAAEHGSKKVLLGLGGSATNDGGCGCAAALGVRFFDAGGAEFIPTGGTLSRIAALDAAPARALLDGVALTILCDIDNPLHGKNGAAYIFAPQKGASPAAVEFLDGQLIALDAVFRRCLGKDVSAVPGAGAAGGFGAGMLAFFDAALCSGIEAVMETVRFDELLSGCDLVFTGEGRLDSQSLRGKVICGVAQHAKAQGVPVVAVVGAVAEDANDIFSHGLSAVFSINRQAVDFRISAPHSAENYRRTLENILRLIRAAERFGPGN